MDIYKQLIEVIKLAEKYYSKNKIRHVLRVACFACEDAQTRININPLLAFIVGIAHDFLEDTECPPEELENAIGKNLMSSVITLTKKDDLFYDDYIQEIFNSKDSLAILVKKADMKDHFMQEDTLTDKLLKKYLPYIKEFL